MLWQHQPLRGHERVRWALQQVLIVLVAVFVYFQVRGLTQAAPATARRHAEQVHRFEAWIGIDWEDTIQAPLRSSPLLQTLANWVYIWGHWPVIVATMAWLVWRHRPGFVQLRDSLIASGALGLVVFASYPVAPPRLVDGDLVDTVTERSYAYRVLQPPNFVNQYAAMPSLHVGFDLLVGIALATCAGSLAFRVLGWVLPAFMAVAVVATANHYVLDVVVGIGFALAGHALARLRQRQRQRQRQERHAVSVRRDPPGPPPSLSERAA